MKAQGGSGGTASPILSFAARWTQVINVMLQPFCAWKRTLMHLTRDWVGPRADMDVYEDDNISCLDQDSNSGLSSP